MDMCVCMYEFLNGYVCIHVWVHEWICVYACMYVCVYVCMSGHYTMLGSFVIDGVYMYVCMYACIYMYMWLPRDVADALLGHFKFV
jgi:hypothetical protein